jgi:Hydantoinase/oxoprolinase N-terminal region
MSYRLGVDVGGTFTDLLLINEITGETFRAKVPSTPSDQSLGVLAGIGKICAAAGIRPAEILDLTHGTTVATNAMLEGKGATVGLITTAGYRQVLQIARSFVPGGLAGWIVWRKPDPLAALENTFEVAERIGARGEVVRPLDEGAAKDALGKLKARGVEAVTVSLINSFANDAPYRRTRARGDSRREPVAFVRCAARDARIRARADDGREFLRQAGGRALPRQPRRPARASRASSARVQRLWGRSTAIRRGRGSWIGTRGVGEDLRAA